LHGSYYAVVGVDVLLGFFGVLSGAALLKNKPWAWEPCAVFWGAGSAISAIMLVEIPPQLLYSWWERGVHSRDLILVPRCINYVVAAATAPFGIRILVTPSPTRRPPTLTMAMWLGISALSGAAFIAVMMLVPSRS
jgi:hypothetical protein